VLMLLLVGSTAAWGWSRSGGPVAGPTASPTPAGCAIAHAGSPIVASAAGGLCGFNLGARVVGLDCASTTSLPPEIHALSVDPSGNSGKGGAKFGFDSTGCHFSSPTYQVDSRLESIKDLPAGNTMFLADVVSPAVGTLSVGFLFGCDGKGCIDTDFYVPAGTIDVFEGDTSLVSRHADAQAGANRLLVTIRGVEVKVWFNGELVATQSVSRLHGAGSYSLFVDSFDKTKTVSMDVQRFAVYRLAA